MRQHTAHKFGFYEGLNVGVVAAQRDHHGAAAHVVRRQRAVGRLPHCHERHRARGHAGTGLGQRAQRLQGGKIDANAATSLQRHHGFAQGAENAVGRILHRPHHKAVEQRGVALSASGGQNAPTWQKAKVAQNDPEALAPVVALATVGRACARQVD